jgi:cation:H+ antiporter
VADGALAVLFLVAAATSLGASWLLVSRIERLGARVGLSDALLGMLAALAADGPEITAAVTALAGHHARIGAGVVIGSNVFNLAALLGFASVVAGRIALHRPVIALEALVALWIAGGCLAVVAGAFSAVATLIAVLAVFAPYVAVHALPRDRRRRVPLPAAWARWLAAAIQEEERELKAAIHPRLGHRADALGAGGALAIVVAASIVMEQAASRLGTRNAIPGVVTGALVLAGVTSLPNAVAAVYLARRGRGAATLSTAVNSNAINVVAGLLVPASIVGVGPSSGESTLIAAWYLGLTGFSLVGAYLARGVGRLYGALIIGAYLALAVVVVKTA